MSELTGVDMVWIDSGELLGRTAVGVFASMGVPLVLFNHDDPTGSRDGPRFASLLSALKQYSLVVTVRSETASELKALGAKRVLKVWRTYDEIAHAPWSDTAEISDKFRSEVAFIGTWMRYEGRDEFILRLADLGVDIAIWGDRWQKSPRWRKIKEMWRGPALSGRDYVAACQGAKVCIGLLSAGNRDLHTTRSLEIPYMGGVLCAERTIEHLKLYEDGVHAVFWDDAEECAGLCKALLADETRREKIRRAGMQRVRELKVGNEDVCRQILTELFRDGST